MDIVSFTDQHVFIASVFKISIEVASIIKPGVSNKVRALLFGKLIPSVKNINALFPNDLVENRRIILTKGDLWKVTYGQQE